MLFSVMVVFLFQVLALLKIGHDTTERWGRYNTACQKKAEVLRWRETVAGRAGSRAARADAVQGLEFYMMRAEFLRGRSAEEPHEAHTAVGGKRLPDDFDYAAYLGTSLGHMLAEVVEMTIPTWCVLALRCFVAPLARLTSHSYYPLVTHRGLMWVLAVAYTGAELALAGAVLPLALVWAAMGAADAVLCVLMVKKLSWIRKQMFAPSDAPELYHASTGARPVAGTNNKKTPLLVNPLLVPQQPAWCGLAADARNRTGLKATLLGQRQPPFKVSRVAASWPGSSPHLPPPPSYRCADDAPLLGRGPWPGAARLSPARAPPLLVALRRHPPAHVHQRPRRGVRAAPGHGVLRGRPSARSVHQPAGDSGGPRRPVR